MERLIPLEKACALLGAHPNTVRSWEEKGRIKIVYSVGGKRRVSESEILRLTGSVPARQDGRVAIYARVSSHEQKQKQKQKGDLERTFTSHGVDLIVHDPVPVGSPGGHQERVEDLLRLVTSFSGRLYGLRSHSKARALVQAVQEVLGAPEPAP